MKTDGTEGLAATLLASPSPADPTRTSESSQPTASTPPTDVPSPAAKPRDPERYQILGEHGRGGLGRVSRARDRDLGRDIAIKELISRGPVSEVRFLREALVTARLEHPGIVPVYEAGRWPDGTPFYAMKLVAGRSLRDLLAERTTADERIALLHHVIAVADAIAYAHGRNIIHRDLKPANVIAGDFGETVVIDWGLAKDLTQREEASAGVGLFRVTRDDDLTSAGAVLGTPAYMAPEQERGEPVDQRADVFAIGAMLWELCAVQKLPPGYSGQRRRILRQAGIDQDLVAIIDKAVDPEPACRYPDAGALAADLKAFKAGARIAARRYSLLAMFTHWTRRHRALALSVTAVTALALTGSVLYVRNIAAERRRAIVSERAAEHAEVAAETSLDALTVQHAELLLATDPSAVIDALATYHGARPERAQQLRAEATGRGVASLRAAPHTDAIHWVHGNPDGTVISFSVDGTITRTSPDATSVVLAKDGTHRTVFAYSPVRRLLAYACDPSDLCILDTTLGRHFLVAHDPRGLQLDGVSFSPDGTRLAAISQTGDLRIVDVTALDHPAEHLHLDTVDGGAVLFVAPDAIAVGTAAGLKVIHMTGKTQILLDRDGSFWDADTTGHRLALATTRGQGLLAETDELRVIARATLCQDDISGLKFIPGQDAVAFVCREGTVGTWELGRGTITPRAHLEGHAQIIEVSASGDYLIAAGDSGVVTMVDLDTQLVTSLRGHGVRVVAIAPPTTEYPYVLSADLRGRIRAWPLPDRLARVAASMRRRIRSAVFNEKLNATIAITLLSKITVFSPSTGIQLVGPHEENAALIELAPDHSSFATYGSNASIELWSTLAMSRTHVFDTHHGSVTHVAFVAGTNDLVTSGRDGQLVARTATGEAKLLAAFDQPVTNFALASATGATVITTADGALWRLDPTGHAVPVKGRGVQVTRMVVLPDGVSVAVGYASGQVIVVDTSSWQQTSLLHAAEGVRDIAFTRDGRTIAVAANNDTIHVGIRHGASWDETAEWTAWPARARKVALTSDGLLVVACADGTVWIYASTRKTWLFVPTRTSDLTQVVLTSDDKASVVFDDEGHIIWIDLEAARKAVRTAK